MQKPFALEFNVRSGLAALGEAARKLAPELGKVAEIRILNGIRNRTDLKLPNPSLLRPVCKRLPQALQSINDYRLVQNLSRRMPLSPKADCKILAIGASGSGKALREINERNQLGKIARITDILVRPGTLSLAFQAEDLSENLGLIHELGIIQRLNHNWSLESLNLDSRLGMEAEKAARNLVIAQDIRMVKRLAERVDMSRIPQLTILRETGEQVCALMRKANDWNLAHNLGNFGHPLALPNLRPLHILSRQTQTVMGSAHQIWIMSPIAESEKIRQKLIEECLTHAAWAGDDLQKWRRLHKEYKKRPKRHTLMARLLTSAHRDFLGILAETRKISEIRERCEDNPFLLYEFEKLQEKIALSNEEQAKLAKRQESVETGEEWRESDIEEQETQKTRSSLRM